MAHLLRAFIAVELPAILQASLKNVIHLLQQSDNRSVRWIPTHNIHLTIKFLGDIDQDTIPGIIQVLIHRIRNYAAFSVRLSGLGAFPGLDRPRVIWAGMEAPKTIFELHQDIENELSVLGFPRENRPFSPHLTLGRIRNNADISGIRKLSALIKRDSDFTSGPAELDHLTFFRSELTPGGAVYTPLHRLKLESPEFPG